MFKQLIRNAIVHSEAKYLKIQGKPVPVMSTQIMRGYAGDVGSGAGRGGGAGGSVRESGGGLGRLGAANEEGYFFGKEKEKLEKLKKKLKSEPQKQPEIQKEPE